MKPQVKPVPDRLRTDTDRCPSADLSAVLPIEAGQVRTGPDFNHFPLLERMYEMEK